MVLEIIKRLSGEAIRGLARSLFPGFYERDISANRALTELRGAGLGYRRSLFLRDFQEGRSQYDQYSKVKFVNLNSIPTEGILQSKYHGVPDRYSFVFKATYRDLETGKDNARFFFYHRNSLDTRANMENDAADWLKTQAESYGANFENVSIREGYINPVWK